MSSDQLKPPGEGNWVEYVDERRKLLLYGGPVTHPLGTLAAEGWEDFELLSTSRALSDASGLGEGAGRTHLVPAGRVPEAAAAIVDTAVERKCDLIVVAMPYRKRLGRVYVGRTVQNVYVNAPCAVLAYRQEETK